ncbi:unnamed protein product [Protopolystoma xenopodis]|uniref:Uncharacterized protein n=1 Tax=Protopolystoma xenopodis TaxID=117903 RepID=A0A3S5B5T6_9PLAT|nr:unnamed protein product [Protopolystoma xenopodis]
MVTYFFIVSILCRKNICYGKHLSTTLPDNNRPTTPTTKLNKPFDIENTSIYRIERCMRDLFQDSSHEHALVGQVTYDVKKQLFFIEFDVAAKNAFGSNQLNPNSGMFIPTVRHHYTSSSRAGVHSDAFPGHSHVGATSFASSSAASSVYSFSPSSVSLLLHLNRRSVGQRPFCSRPCPLYSSLAHEEELGLVPPRGRDELSRMTPVLSRRIPRTEPRAVPRFRPRNIAGLGMAGFHLETPVESSCRLIYSQAAYKPRITNPGMRELFVFFQRLRRSVVANASAVVASTISPSTAQILLFSTCTIEFLDVNPSHPIR